MALSPEDEAKNVRSKARGLDRRSDAVLALMNGGLDEDGEQPAPDKTGVYDAQIRSLTVFPDAKLDELDKEGITGARAQTQLDEDLQYLETKKARLIDKKEDIQGEIDLRADGKVTRTEIID